MDPLAEQKIQLFKSIAKSQGFSDEEIEPFAEFAKLKVQEDAQQIVDPIQTDDFALWKAKQDYAKSLDESSGPYDPLQDPQFMRDYYQKQLEQGNPVEGLEGYTPEKSDQRSAQEALIADIGLFNKNLNEVRLRGPSARIANQWFGENKGEASLASQFFDPQAADFDAQRNQLAFSMASAIANQTGRGLSDRDLAVFMRALPERKDRPAVANRKLQNAIDQLKTRLRIEGTSEAEIDNLTSSIESELGTKLPDSPDKVFGEDEVEVKKENEQSFFDNAVEDIKNNVQGLANLPEVLMKLGSYNVPGTDITLAGPTFTPTQGFKAYTPEQKTEILEAIVEGTIKEYEELAKAPIETSYEKPVTTLLNILAVLPLANAAKARYAGTAGKAGKVAEAGTASKLASQADDVARAANVTTKLAEKAYATLFEVSKRKGTIGLNPLETSHDLVRYGIKGNSWDDLISQAYKVTGRDGIVNKVKVNAIAEIPDINISGVTTTLKEGLRLVDDMSDAQVTQRIQKAIRASGEQTTIGKLNPLDAFDFQRWLEERASLYNREYLQSALPKSKQLMSAYRNAADEISLQIDKQVGNIKIDNFKTPEVIQALDDISPNLARDFIKARNVSELRRLERPFVQLAKMAEETKNNFGRIAGRRTGEMTSRLVGAGVGGTAAGVPGALGGFVLGPVVEPIIVSLAESLRIPLTTRFATSLPKVKAPSIKMPSTPSLPKTPSYLPAIPFMRRGGEAGEEIENGGGGGELPATPSLNNVIEKSPVLPTMKVPPKFLMR